MAQTGAITERVREGSSAGECALGRDARARRKRRFVRRGLRDGSGWLGLLAVPVAALVIGCSSDTTSTGRSSGDSGGATSGSGGSATGGSAGNVGTGGTPGGSGGRGGTGGSIGTGGTSDAGILDGSLPTHDGPYSYFYANPVNFGHVYGVPAGTTTSVVFATGSDPHNIGAPFTFDASRVYYGDAVFVGANLKTSLVALPTTGSHRIPTTLVSDLHTVQDITVDDSFLYFVDVDDEVEGGNVRFATSVGRVPLAGGKPTILATDTAVSGVALAVFGGYVYWTESGTAASGVVRRVPATGGAAETLAADQRNPAAIAVNSSGVFWIDQGDLGVDCAPTNGSVQYRAADAGDSTTDAGTTVTVASNLAGSGSLVLNDGNAYWTTTGPECNAAVSTTGTIWKLPNPSATASSLVTDLIDPSSLYVDATHVFFTVVTDPENYVLRAAEHSK